MNKEKIKSNVNELTNDPYWAPLLYILFNVNSLRRHFLNKKYIDFENRILEVNKLLEDSKHLSSSEKALINLGIHLFNSSYNFRLDQLDRLDSNNINIAFEAMRMRFY